MTNSITQKDVDAYFEALEIYRLKICEESKNLKLNYTKEILPDGFTRYTFYKAENEKQD